MTPKSHIECLTRRLEAHSLLGQSWELGKRGPTHTQWPSDPTDPLPLRTPPSALSITTTILARARKRNSVNKGGAPGVWGGEASPGQDRMAIGTVRDAEDTLRSTGRRRRTGTLWVYDERRRGDETEYELSLIHI